MDEVEGASIEWISDEVLLKIFSELSHKDVLKVGRVNKRFHRVSQDPSLNRNLWFGNSGENLHLSANVLRNYVHKYSGYLESFSFIDCYWITPQQLCRLLKPCRNLRELDLIGCDLSLRLLDVLLQNNKQLTKLGWSIPSKDLSPDLFTDEREQTELNTRIQQSLLQLKSLKLRFYRLVHFETIVSLFPYEMTLNELCLEYRGQKTTSIIHAGSDYSIDIKSNCPFPAYLNSLHFINRYLHFNLILMDFVTKVVLHAAETDQLTCLLAPGSRNSLCWKYIAPSYKTSLLTMIDLSSTCLTAEQMNWLGKLENLTYLNLQHVQDFKLNLMKAIAMNCPNLETLNLHNCADWIDKDLCALEVLAKSCTKLKNLNLGKICCHTSAFSQQGNLFCKRISALRQLKSLSISPCCAVNTTEDDSAASRENHPMIKLPPRRSTLLDNSSQCSSSQVLLSAGYVTRYVTQQRQYHERVIQIGSGLDMLIEELKHIEQFELIDVGYSSVFSVPDECSGLSFICPTTRSLKDASLLSLKSWTKLKSLTLAGLPGLGSFSSLIDIAAHCKCLEFLSLANIGLPGHSNALAYLPEALNNCQSLKTLRLDQPHYHINEKFLQSLYSCKRLESICIICKDAKIPKEPDSYVELFEACQSLCVLQLFSGAPSSTCKQIQKELIRRYQRTRPPLSIAILHFSQSLTEDGLQTIPYAHLKNLTCFETRVATRR
eukprot:gene10958-12119_t